MKTSFLLWIFIGVVAGTTIGLILSNIVAGVTCCSALSNMPVLFMKRKTRVRSLTRN